MTLRFIPIPNALIPRDSNQKPSRHDINLLICPLAMDPATASANASAKCRLK